MASIYKRKNKEGKTISWKAVIRIKGHPAVCKSFERKQEAEDWAQATEKEIKRGRFKFNLHNKLYTFDEIVERFINDGVIENHKSARDTIRHLDFWKEKFGKYALVHITTEMIGRERQTLINTPIKKGSKVSKRSPATVNRYMSSLSAVLTYARKIKWITENPCHALSKLKESNGRDKVLSIEESSRLLEACKESSNQYLYCIVLIAITTGMRKGEIMNLKWNQIDFENNLAHIIETKNGKPRSVPLINEVIEELKQIHKTKKPHKQLTFSSKTAFGKLDIKKPWQQALKKADINSICFHSLRHTFATFAARQGASNIELATAMGHRSLQMLQHYSHLEANMTRKFSENISKKILGDKK